MVGDFNITRFPSKKLGCEILLCCNGNFRFYLRF
jgi:hypothetical protein